MQILAGCQGVLFMGGSERYDPEEAHMSVEKLLYYFSNLPRDRVMQVANPLFCPWDCWQRIGYSTD